MRRLPAALVAAALLALTLPILAVGQTIDPGTPTTIAPAPGTSTSSDGATGTTPTAPGDGSGVAPGATGTAPAAPPATQTTPVPTETTPAPPATSAVPPPVTTQPPPATGQPAPTSEQAPADEGGSSRIALVVLIVLGALVVLIVLALAIARWQAVEPPWWPRARHSLAEFGWRASGAWSDFADWVRLGR
jgi:hypothetical protein